MNLVNCSPIISLYFLSVDMITTTVSRLKTVATYTGKGVCIDATLAWYILFQLCFLAKKQPLHDMFPSTYHMLINNIAPFRL